MAEVIIPFIAETGIATDTKWIGSQAKEPVARIPIGSLGIDTYSESGLIDSVLQHALSGDYTRQIVTANAQFFVLAESDSRFHQCLDDAEYICADGMPLAWACERFGGTKVPRITGVDFIEQLCRYGAAGGLRIYLLGGRPGAAAATAAVLQERYPGTIIAGVSCPDFGFEKDPSQLTAVLRDIEASCPHVVFAGLGAPKQEFFISEHLRPLHVPIAVGIGGSFEIISGQLERAPIWTRGRSLEWAYRLAKEPRRLWKRYLFGNAAFIWGLAKWWLRGGRVASTMAADMRG